MDTDKIIFHSKRKENYDRSDWEYMNIWIETVTFQGPQKENISLFTLMSNTDLLPVDLIQTTNTCNWNKK